MTVSQPPLRDQNSPRVQMTTIKVPPKCPLYLIPEFTHVNAGCCKQHGSFIFSMEWNCIFFNSNPFQASVSQMTTIGGQLSYQQQPLSTLVNSIQTMPVQSSTVFPPIVSSRRVYETAAGTHTDVQPCRVVTNFSQPLALASHLTLPMTNSALIRQQHLRE